MCRRRKKLLSELGMQEASCNPKAVAFAGDVYCAVAGDVYCAVALGMQEASCIPNAVAVAGDVYVPPP